MVENMIPVKQNENTTKTGKLVPGQHAPGKCVPVILFSTRLQHIPGTA